MLYFNIPRTEKYSIAMCYFLGGHYSVSCDFGRSWRSNYWHQVSFWGATENLWRRVAYIVKRMSSLIFCNLDSWAPEGQIMIESVILNVFHCVRIFRMNSHFRIHKKGAQKTLLERRSAQIAPYPFDRSQILFRSIEFGLNYDDLSSFLLPWFPIFTKPWSSAVELCNQLLV